jgi:hypothetical protein
MKMCTLWRPVIGQISGTSRWSRLECRVSRMLCPITPIDACCQFGIDQIFGNMTPKFDLVVINGTIVTASDIR